MGSKGLMRATQPPRYCGAKMGVTWFGIGGMILLRDFDLRNSAEIDIPQRSAAIRHVKRSTD